MDGRTDGQACAHECKLADLCSDVPVCKAEDRGTVLLLAHPANLRNMDMSYTSSHAHMPKLPAPAHMYVCMLYPCIRTHISMLATRL